MEQMKKTKIDIELLNRILTEKGFKKIREKDFTWSESQLGFYGISKAHSNKLEIQCQQDSVYGLLVKVLLNHH